MSNPYFYSRPILVAGGAGLIGNAVCRELIDRSARQVVVLDTFQSSSSKLQSLPAGVIPFHGSVLDRDILRKIKKLYRPAVVFHFAGVVGKKNIINKPRDTVLVNTQGTANLLDILSDIQKPTFVFSSAGEIYGSGGPHSELGASTIGPLSTHRWSYATSKLAGEAVVLGTSIRGARIIVRPFSVVGPAQRGTVIPTFVRNALNGEDLVVYDDGEMTRCFVHVDDVARGIVDLAELWETGIYNIGKDTPTDINGLASIVLELTSSKSKVVHKPYEEVFGNRFDVYKDLIPDLSRIKQRIGYSPKRTIIEIVHDVIESVTDEMEMRKRSR